MELSRFSEKLLSVAGYKLYPAMTAMVGEG